MTEEALKEIEARANAAIPGPWSTYGDEESGLWIDTPRDKPAFVVGYEGEIEAPTARFVAHAREDVPALVAEVRRLKAEAATMAEWVRCRAPPMPEDPALLRNAYDLALRYRP